MASFQTKPLFSFEIFHLYLIYHLSHLKLIIFSTLLIVTYKFNSILQYNLGGHVLVVETSYFHDL